MKETTVQALKARIDSGDTDFVLLDVREAWECQIAALPNATHIPMGQIPSRINELPKDREIVVYCHHGGRSAQVTHHLIRNGFDRAMNLAGGIDAWSREIDNQIARY
ncbi:MAG: rhodanese-like domain-containing protein [Pseudomonadota bacterium]|nr:rhodanese-like domain-containing protein [Pseudomonadota bacterium]